jgi:competence protein ComFC
MPLLERLIDTIAPHDCLGCGREGSLLCAWCQPDACTPLPARCYQCRRLSPYGATCGKCKRQSKLSHVWVRTDYEEVAKKLVARLKFERAQAAAACVAELMLDALPFMPETVIVAHVPTSTVHVRGRGYDQAQLITRHLATLLGRRQATLLARLGRVQQVGSKREERLTQLAGAFRPMNRHLIKGAHILLVDDVLTTGATLEEAARTLKQAGAKQVDAAVFAQTL